MKISIIGAGNVGATLANRIIESDIADVVLVDVYKSMAQGKALDLLHAAPLVGYQKNITGTDDYGKIENSKIVVVTAGFPRQPGMTRLDLISKNSGIIKDVMLNIKQKCHRAIVIVVTNPLDVMTFLAHRESSLRRERIFGMAGVLDASRFAYIIAKELKVKHDEVETLVLGQHGPQMVPLISHTKVSGEPLRRLLPKEKIDKLIEESRGSGAHIVGLLGKGSAYYAPSAAIFAMIKAIVKNEKKLMSVSCFANGEYGINGVCTGLPVILGKDGIEEVARLRLDPEEEEALKKAARINKRTFKRSMNKYDITIIGAGPGGYVAALYAASHGKNVMIIEENQIGGVCLNWGCIPTKTLLASVEALKNAKRAKEFGIEIPSYSIDYKAIKNRKDNVVTTLKKGIESLFKSKNVTLKIGHGTLVDKGVVEVGGERIESKDVIIATGTRPAEIPAFKFDKDKILSSADILELESLPKSLLIVGGGVNGCEYAYTFRHLGVEVGIVEMMDRLLPTMDKELGKNMEMMLKKAGVKVMTKTKLDSLPAEYEKAVICIGRRYNTEGLGLEDLGIKTEKGSIIVDRNLKTGIPGIYAIGDAIGGYLLAHVASHEGIIACDNILGRESRMDYGSVPLCIYTEPQIATVGLSEEGAKESGREIKISKIPFRAIGKAHAIGEKDGFVKIIGDKNNGEVLGVQMVGHQVTEMIHEAAMAVKNKMAVKDICELIHAHPTLSEAFMEAAFSFEGRGIHST